MRAIILTSAMVLVMILGGCSTSRVAGPGVYYDDIYYVPGVSRDNVNDAFSPVPSLTREQEKEESRALAARQNEYNRSERANAQQDMRDFSGVQEEYATILTDENIQDTDTLLYYNDETGYWVDGFEGSSMDRDYAERLVRFHSPAVRIPYYSPFYSEVVYYNHYDWNVYVDGNYAYAFPTWTNRWYDYYYYNSWHRPYSNFHFGWSYGYPYYGGGYYGYGWNHYSPYYAYNHWNSPYYYGYNNYYHNNHYYGGGGYYNRPGSQQVVNRGMRQGLNSDRSTISSRGARNNDALKTGTDQRSGVSLRGQSSERNPRGTTTAQNDDRPVRGTVSRPQSETKSTGASTTTGRRAARDNYSESTPTRRSYTPTYSQTEGNTRPVYNRATYTRVSNSPRPAQSTGTVQPRTTTTRPAQTTGGTRSVQSPTQSRQVTPAATQTRQSAPATQSTRPVQQRSTTTQPSSGSTTRPAATRPAATRSSAPATYQRGSSAAPTRSTTRSSSAPSRSYSAPAATSSSSSSSYSAPSRSSSSSSSSSSGSSSSRGSSSSSGSSRGSGGRR